MAWEGGVSDVVFEAGEGGVVICEGPGDWEGWGVGLVGCLDRDLFFRDPLDFSDPELMVGADVRDIGGGNDPLVVVVRGEGAPGCGRGLGGGGLYEGGPGGGSELGCN